MADTFFARFRRIVLLALVLLGRDDLAQARDQTARFGPWRQQSRDEPRWVSRQESANYEGLKAAPSLPKESLSWRGLDPAFAARVEQLFNAAKAAGLNPQFVSGFRPGAYQQQMVSSYASGDTGGIQAQPGTRSFHTKGFAVDMEIGSPERMLEFVKLAYEQGLAFTVDGDPNHLELVDSLPIGPVSGERLPLVTFREFLEAGVPNELRVCGDCAPRPHAVKPADRVAQQLQREYRIRKEVSEFLAKSRLEMARMRLEKPDPFHSEPREYRSVFGNDYTFDNPFGGSEPDTDANDDTGFFGDWTFDDIEAPE